MISDKVKNLRISKNMSQYDLADKLKISKKEIQDFEDGLITLPFYVFIKISEIFNINIETLIINENDNHFISENKNKINIPGVIASAHVKPSYEEMTFAFKRYNKIKIIMLLVSTIYSLVFGIIYYSLANDLPVFIGCLISFLILLIILFVKKKRYEKIYTSLDFATYENNFVFYKDKVEIKTISTLSNNAYSIKYSDIKKVKIYDNSVIFNAKNKLFYLNKENLVYNDKNENIFNYFKNVIYSKETKKHVSNENTIKEIKKNTFNIILLNILSFLSILTIIISFIGIYVVSINSKYPGTKMDPEHFKNLIYFLFIPFICVICGIIFLCKKNYGLSNIIVGGIIGVILLQTSCIYPMFSDVSHNTIHHKYLEKKLDIDLPNESYVSYSTIGYENSHVIYHDYTFLRFTNQHDIEIFEQSLEEQFSHWDNKYNAINYYKMNDLYDYDYFYIYSRTLNTHEISKLYTNQKYLLLAYDCQENVLFAIQITIK